MKFKLKLLAAAGALAMAAGGAQAQLSSPGSGTLAVNAANGSLVFAALDSVGSPISFTANLGYNLLSFLPTSPVVGQTIVWNFATNAVTVDGVARAASTGNYQYSAPFAAFTGAAQSADLTWGVFAADNNGNTTQTNALNLARRNVATTGAPTALDLVPATSSITNAKIGGATANIATLTTVLNTSIAPNTIQSGIGAQTATSGSAYIGDSGGQSLRRDYGGQFTFDYMVADKATSNFTLFTGGSTGTLIGAVAQYGNEVGLSTFTFDVAANTLTFATPVPEPESVAMMLAGLAFIGSVVVRRRKTA